MKTPQQIIERINALVARIEAGRHDGRDLALRPDSMDFEVDAAEQIASELREHLESERVEIACDIGEFKAAQPDNSDIAAIIEFTEAMNQIIIALKVLNWG